MKKRWREHQHQRVKDNMYTVCILKIMPHCKFTAIVVHLLHVFTQYWLLLLQLLLLSLDERCNGILVAHTHTLTHSLNRFACSFPRIRSHRPNEVDTEQATNMNTSLNTKSILSVTLLNIVHKTLDFESLCICFK